MIILQTGGFSAHAKTKRSKKNIGATNIRMNYCWKIKVMTEMLENIILRMRMKTIERKKKTPRKQKGQIKLHISIGPKVILSTSLKLNDTE